MFSYSVNEFHPNTGLETAGNLFYKRKEQITIQERKLN